MKRLYLLLLLVLVGFVPLNGQAQVGTSCMGCMPRTGQVYDSTKTTPAPSFTTSASTGDVYIPPREVIVTVPGPSTPSPVGNDPMSFESTRFTCDISGVGIDGASGATVALYKSLGGRCADTEGMIFWATNLVNCVARENGWEYANTMGVNGYSGWASFCGIGAGINSNINVDQPSMNGICAADAATRGFATTAYNYVRSPSSRTCSK